MPTFSLYLLVDQVQSSDQSIRPFTLRFMVYLNHLWVEPSVYMCVQGNKNVLLDRIRTPAGGQ